MANTDANALIDFQYSGIDRRGQKVKGETQSHNIEQAKASLRKQGINVSNIKKKPKQIQLFKPKITPTDVAIFARQLATMMKAGVPLTQGFGIVADSLENPAMKDLVMQLKTDIEGGSTFAEALVKHPEQFDDLFCSLVDAGEQAGALENMLDRVATYKEKSEALKSKIKKALKYPMSVIVVAVIVTMILLIKVVPVFSGLFGSFGAELPAFTQMVVNMSDWMKSNWWMVILIVGGIGISFTQAKKRSKAFRDFLDKLSLKLPIVGPITYQAVIARFARTLSTTFSAGVPMIEALDSTAGATNNIVYYNATQQIKEDVSTGQQLQFAIKSTNLFPNMAIQMVGIGEESGALEEMLDKVANYYEMEVDNAVDGLTSMMEPLIMAVLGVLVGGLVIAMYLPIFQMGQVV